LNFKLVFLGASLVMMLSACGGGTTSSDQTSGSAPLTAAPGGIYVGYYQEDATNNPEDPTVGALYLSLPVADSAFNGSMSFTYVGCQSYNVGTISGTKSGLDLTGNWTGSTDGSPQAGSYTGTFDADKALYRGKYTVSGGKQHIDRLPCIEYYIAALGTWELFPLDKTYTSAPTATGVIVEGTKITWYPPQGTTNSFVSVIDQSIANSGGANAIVWQNIFNAGTSFTNIPGSVSLVSGRTYIASAASTANGVRNYFSSKSFVAN
jgi:hypothetical protein